MTKKHTEHLSTRRLIIWLSGISIGLLIGTALFYQLQYQHAFYPGTMIAGERVGGRLFEDVLREKLEAAEILSSQGITLVVSSPSSTHEVNIPVSSQGLTADTVVEYFSIGSVEATIAEAYSLGRTGPLLRRIREQLAVGFFKKNYDIPIVIREAALTSLLEREVDALLSKARDARFTASAGVVSVVPEASGEAIDIPYVIGAIMQSASTLKTGPIAVAVSPVDPRVRASDLEPQREFAQQLSRSVELVFRYGSRRAYATGNTLVSWLTVVPATGVLTINPEAVERFVFRNIDTLIDDAPRNSRFEMRRGVLTEIVPGTSGNAVNGPVLVSQILERIEEIRSSESKTYSVLRFDVPVTVQEPAITAATIGKYKIVDLLGATSTSLGSSSASRRKNITLGIERINGLLIAPGEEFSAVNTIGYVTEEAGFEPEFVIKDQESVKELGGGLCQVSTTLFRSVLTSGLPITERQEHKYVVGYYGPGLDATIYGPHPDLKFVNDTGNYILVQGRVAGNEAMFEIYGVKDGRKASISSVEVTDRIPPPEPKYIPSTELAYGEQKCTETARYGLTSDATYTVKYANGQSREQKFHSVYQPWQKVCLVGIGAQAAQKIAQ